MAELLTAAEMRALERAAIDGGTVTGLELMERAGQGVVDAIFAEWPELDAAAADGGASPSRSPEYLEKEEKGRRALVLCGPGNNGGDGFVVARLLREKGWSVDVYLFGDAEKLPPDARSTYERWIGVGAVRPYVDAEFRKDAAEIGERSLIIDALFGTGLSRPVMQVRAFGLATQMSLPPRGSARGGPGQRAATVVAIDIPSGLDADSGRLLLPENPPREHETVRADLTVTFHTAKPGHYLDEGPNSCGALRIVDIGLREALAGLDVGDVPKHGGVAPCRGIEAPQAARLGKSRGNHKFSHGHALVLSGGPGRTGAARLAARGALRVGAGLVTLGVPPAAMQEVAAQVTAVMQMPVRDADGLARNLEDRRINALCLGPGLGTGAREADLVRIALRGDHAGRSVVLDADALTLVAGAPELFEALNPRCVLTPHGGEFARLFPDIHEKLAAPAATGPAYSKVDAARDAAARAGCVVLFKGPDTVIAAPDGKVSVHAAVYDRAAPWLATAGAGDVLAGLITGLLARGFDPMQAAETGAWLHVECARRFGPGLIAEDLPEMLPGVLAALKH
ncbi:NAD(P)H-hydrate dehydratase [Chachezhania antarctica]|uniref:NAD(P)H-hydrate dehydratase n=1 Tax=Chachezhania antarctica TaxID=2340860 RepID=UPI000EB3438D|nr:NAD(P)H-hydrate dehydratase [Chachezhania antarctica]|tara:strand:+ start:3000 stop:4700 length:1701 start_codon:yes stop_codon:yes gene_type:complete